MVVSKKLQQKQDMWLHFLLNWVQREQLPKPLEALAAFTVFSVD